MGYWITESCEGWWSERGTPAVSLDPPDSVLVTSQHQLNIRPSFGLQEEFIFIYSEGLRPCRMRYQTRQNIQNLGLHQTQHTFPPR